MCAGRKRPRGECVTFDLDATDDGRMMCPMTITAAPAGACDADCTLESAPCTVPVGGGEAMRLRGQFCIMCPVNAKKCAKYDGTCGKTNKLCAEHSRQMKTYKVPFPCIACPPGAKKTASFNDKQGNTRKLCHKHVDEFGTRTVINPCLMCPPGAEKSANYNDTEGNPRKLCAKHSRQMKTYTVPFLCIACPPGAEKTSSFSDTKGNPRKLCGNHVDAFGTRIVLNPCTACPVGAKRSSNYDGLNGLKKQLCAKHSKLAKTHAVLHPCPDCPTGDEKQGNYPGRPGGKQLCGGCARVAGTFTVRNPCTKCPFGTTEAHYTGEDGVPNQLCAQHAKDAGTHEPGKQAQCANCQDNASRWFSAESTKFAGERACLPCLTCFDKTHPIALRRDRELKCLGAIVELIRTQLGRPDLANAIRELGFNDCAEGPSRRRGDQVFPIVATLIGQIEVDENDHKGYNTSCKTAKVAGHIADRNGIHRRSSMDGDADEKLAQLRLIDKVCHPDAGTQVVNTHVWRVDTTDAFKYHPQHRAWEPVQVVFMPLMLRVAESIVTFVDSVTPSPSDTPAAASAARAVVLSHSLWKVEEFHASPSR